MAVTDYKRAKLFALNHRFSDKKYKELVMTLEALGNTLQKSEKYQEKKTFFGQDKSRKYKDRATELYQNVLDKIGLVSAALIAEGNIEFLISDFYFANGLSSKVTEVINTIYDDLEEFSRCYPNWAWAYFLYPQVFNENNEQIIEIISKVLEKAHESKFKLLIWGRQKN